MDAHPLQPSFERIDAVLRVTTALLTRELVAASDEPPAWDEVEWGIARAVVTMQGIAPLLAMQSRWSDRPSWHRFLQEQRQHVAARQRRIEALLTSLDVKAQARGVALVPLKGAALHALGLYQAGDRPMADLDLLVSLPDKDAATQLMTDCGFDITFENRRHQLFEMRGVRSRSVELGEHADNPIKVELHTAIREHLPVDEVDITDFIFPLHTAAGLNKYRSYASLMMHLLLHAASNMRARALRLIQLHDIARLSARFSAADWDELLTARPNGAGLWWAAPPLILVVRYCSAAVPLSVMQALEKQCSLLLRRAAARQTIADVSWSNIKVYALPGIEWSRSVGEALRFASSRLLPSRETRAELRHYAEHEQGASIIPWYDVSQRQRIMRWLISRPPRVQTLRVVRAALDQTA